MYKSKLEEYFRKLLKKSGILDDGIGDDDENGEGDDKKKKRFKKMRNPNFKTLREYDLYFNKKWAGKLSFKFDKKLGKFSVFVFLGPRIFENKKKYAYFNVYVENKDIYLIIERYMQEYLRLKEKVAKKSKIAKALEKLRKAQEIAEEIHDIMVRIHTFSLYHDKNDEDFIKLENAKNELLKIFNEILTKNINDAEINNEKVRNALIEYNLLLIGGIKKNDAIYRVIEKYGLNKSEINKLLKLLEKRR